MNIEEIYNTLMEKKIENEKQNGFTRRVGKNAREMKKNQSQRHQYLLKRRWWNIKSTLRVQFREINLANVYHFETVLIACVCVPFMRETKDQTTLPLWLR